MRRASRLSVLSLVLLAGCIPHVPPPVSIPPVLPTGHELHEQRQKLAFSFITYAGEQLEGTDPYVEEQLVPCIRRELDGQPLITPPRPDGGTPERRWELVWGPMVYKFNQGTYDDNMMFVARRLPHEGQKEDHLVVALRGTNARAIRDWIREDFDVLHTEQWGTGTPPRGSDPRISRATHTGFEILKNHAPEGGLEATLPIRKFLHRTVKNSSFDLVRIDVTGHSLAGALSPTLALWLSDTQHEWDPEGKAKLAVYAYAGATPGNADFEAYYDSQLASVTRRVHNPYDIVPMAWNLSTLEALPDLYRPVARMGELLRLPLDAFLILLRHSTYTQIRADQAPIPGSLNHQLRSYGDQAEWQHHFGYLCGLGVGDKFYPVSDTCREGTGLQPPEQPVCPSGG